MIKTVLFDMDGTLLPMDQEVFTKTYFKLLCKKLAPRGYEPEALVGGIWAGTAAMVENDGAVTNEEAFWRVFSSRFGERVRADLPLFEEFYRNEFNEARAVCGYTPAAGDAVRRLKAAGVRLVLASNPIFPRIAQENRMRWAGVAPEEFEYLTSYENSRYCKPNPAYYREIAAVLRLEPGECLMVGNDVREDGAAERAGMHVFLLTDCLLNPDGTDLTRYPHGGYADLGVYLSAVLPQG